MVESPKSSFPWSGAILSGVSLALGILFAITFYITSEGNGDEGFAVQMMFYLLAETLAGLLTGVSAVGALSSYPRSGWKVLAKVCAIGHGVIFAGVGSFLVITIWALGGF